MMDMMQNKNLNGYQKTGEKIISKLQTLMLIIKKNTVAETLHW